jgi:hypothetical protein
MVNEMVSSGLQYLTGGSVPFVVVSAPSWDQRNSMASESARSISLKPSIPQKCGKYAVHLGILYTEDGEFGSALKLSTTRKDRARKSTPIRKREELIKT